MENLLQTTGQIQGQVHSHYELSILTTPKMHYQLPPDVQAVQGTI